MHDRSTVAGVLGKDHDDLEEVFQRFRKAPASNREARTATFAEFARGLRRHIGVEETDLFPAITRADPSLEGLVSLLYEDHKLIDTLLRRIEAKIASPSPETGPLESELLNILGDHNIREESFAYPWLDEHLPADQRLRATGALKTDLSDHGG